MGWWAALIVAVWCEVSLLVGIVIAAVGAHGHARAFDKHREPAEFST